MDDENSKILQLDELITEIKSQGEAIAGSMNNQLTTLQLLDGTLLMSYGMHSQLFSAMLGQLSLQSSFAGAQLGEQQLYDAASLEGAAATYLLLDILSGNVGSMVEKLTALANYGQGILTKAEELPALLEKLGGGEKSDITKSGDILTGGLGALGSIQSAKEGVGELAGMAGFAGKGIGLLSGLLSGPALPLIIGAITVAVGGFFALKALKTGIGKDQEKAPSDTGAAASSDASRGGNAEEDLAEKVPPLVVDPTDPFKTGAGDESNYNQYQSQIDSSRQTADTLREAVKVGNDEVVKKLDAVATALQRVAEKPTDRHIKSEVVIQSLSTSMTFSEFRDKLNEVLERETQTAP